MRLRRVARKIHDFGWTREILSSRGCGRPDASDNRMMEAAAPDWNGLLADWRAGRAGKADLYGALRGPMYVAARQGVAFITAQDPDTDDVEEAVYNAFTELMEKDPAAVVSVIGLAKVMAWRRGMDAGRAAVRRRERVRLVADPTTEDCNNLYPVEEVEREEERERLREKAMACMKKLSTDQRDVVQATVMGEEGLSNWAFRNNKSHQAAGRQRDRALETLRRCIDSGAEDEEGR